MTSQLAVRIGSQRPTTQLLPLDRRGSAGAEAVDLAALAGLVLDDWQAWFLEHALSEQRDGKWSAFEVAAIVGRQNGKGSILEARQLAGLYLLGERLQVHTAHEFKTCFEHFLRVTQLIESTPELDARVARIRRGAGEQAVELKGGQRLRFLARSGVSGKGLSGDAIYLDEAFALTPAMMGALLPTLSSRPNPQVWYTSSAALGTSAVLHGVRKRGHDQVPGRLFFAEWGCEPGVDVEDRDNWYRSNPALGIRITEEFIAAELDAMRAMPEEFARERLGVPEFPPSTDGPPAKLDPAHWQASGTSSPPHVEPGELAMAFAVHDGYTSIAIATGTLAKAYVEVIDHRPGTGWVPARLVELQQRWLPTVIGLDGGNGPAQAVLSEVLEAFAEHDIPADTVKPMTSGVYLAACEAMAQAVADGKVSRPVVEDDVLTAAASVAGARTLGTDRWLWDLRSSKVPLSPLVAATVARGLLTEQGAQVPEFFVY